MNLWVYLLLVFCLGCGNQLNRFFADADAHADAALPPNAPSVSGVSDAGAYTASVTPVFVAPPGETYTATLNGAAFASGTVVSASGNYTLVVKSTKAVNGLTASVTITFTLLVTVAASVYGQADFSGILANRTGSATPAADSLSGPRQIMTDASGLYVADFQNNRVLLFPFGSPTASRVYGQLGSFTSAVANNGGLTQHTLSVPRAVWADASGVYIADTGNHRVMFYSGNSIVGSRVYGQGGNLLQANMNNGGLSADSLNGPRGVAADATGVYIADTGNNRVLYYPGTSTTATRVYGQFGNFGCAQINNNSACGAGTATADTLSGAEAIVPTSSGLYIVDNMNNRVLYFAGTSTTASRVYGQYGSFTCTQVNNNGLCGAGGASANNLNAPRAVYPDTLGVYIGDSSNNRALYYPGTSTTATRVYGQGGSFTTNNSGTGASGLNSAQGVSVYNSQLYVSDGTNNRVLAY